ncbi:MAG: NAD-dependent epimerase/dehydratase family protein [Pseudonocardiaceae bacterium]
MRVLVLGGTSFLSKEVASEALRRGHEVICAARGRSGAAPERARLVALDRGEPGDIEALAREKFDAVVDVATGALGWVRDALDVLASEVGALDVRLQRQCLRRQLHDAPDGGGCSAGPGHHHRSPPPVTSSWITCPPSSTAESRWPARTPFARLWAIERSSCVRG